MLLIVPLEATLIPRRNKCVNIDIDVACIRVVEILVMAGVRSRFTQTFERRARARKTWKRSQIRQIKNASYNTQFKFTFSTSVLHTGSIFRGIMRINDKQPCRLSSVSLAPLSLQSAW